MRCLYYLQLSVGVYGEGRQNWRKKIWFLNPFRILLQQILYS